MQRCRKTHSKAFLAPPKVRFLQRNNWTKQSMNFKKNALERTNGEQRQPSPNADDTRQKTRSPKGPREATDQGVFIETKEEGYTVPTQARWVITDLNYTKYNTWPHLLWLLVGTPSAFGPELAYRRCVAQPSLMDVPIFLIYFYITIYVFVPHFYDLSTLVGPPWGPGGLSRECVLRIPSAIVKGD